MQLGSANSIDTKTLIGFVRYLTHSLDDISAFSDELIIAALNRSQEDLQIDILIATKWKIEGGSATQDLIANQVNYAFPTGFLTINRMEADYLGGINTWAVVNPAEFDLDENRAYSNTANNQAIKGTEAHPRYTITGDTGFLLDPPAGSTILSGLKIWHTSKVTDLSQEDDEPIFPEFSHKYLAFEASIELLLPRDSHNLIAELEAKKANIWERIIKFYLQRNQDRKLRIRRANHPIIW